MSSHYHMHLSEQMRNALLRSLFCVILESVSISSSDSKALILSSQFIVTFILPESFSTNSRDHMAPKDDRQCMVS